MSLRAFHGASYGSDLKPQNSETGDFELKNGTEFLVKELQKMNIEELQKKIASFAKERDWSSFTHQKIWRVP